VTAHRFAEDQVVEGGHAIQIREGQLQEIGDIAESFVRNPAAMLLHDLHGIDTDGLARGIVRQFLLDFAGFFVA
jgi:hypothetical protein